MRLGRFFLCLWTIDHVFASKENIISLRLSSYFALFTVSFGLKKTYNILRVLSENSTQSQKQTVCDVAVGVSVLVVD